MNKMTVPVLRRGSDGVSVFRDCFYALEDFHGMMISPRVEAQNFRHRMSAPGYFSPWHVAGDPTLILVRRGILRIGLHGGRSRDFSAGEMFVAQDFLEEGEDFDPERHGHTAEVLGDEPLLAMHLKLAARVE